MTPAEHDALAIEIARKYEQENLKGMTFCDTAEELCRRYRAALKEKMEPVAWVRYSVGSFPSFVPVINGSVTFTCSAMDALEHEPLYSLEDWK